jgi:hypothetical protein
MVSAAQTNTSSGMLFARVELNQGATTGATTGAGTADLYLLASVDDTNFAKGSTTVAPSDADVVFSYEASSVAQRLVSYEIRLPPMDFKWCLENNYGVQLSTGTNVLRAIYYTESVES